MRQLRIIILSIIAFFSTLAQAQYQQQVINLPTRPGVSMRVLLLTPKESKVSVILFAGGHGGLQLFTNGSMRWGDSNFLVRTKGLFADLGATVAIVDAPSDRMRPPFLAGFRNSEEHVQDIKALSTWLHEQNNAPIWLIGTSRGTESAASVGIRLESEPALAGVVLTSSILSDNARLTVPELGFKSYRKKVLIVHHEKDACRVTRFEDLTKLREQLNPSAITEVVTFSGGITQGDPCHAMAYHGFNGIESEVVQKIVNWITKNQN